MQASVQERLTMLAHAAVDMRKQIDKGTRWYEESDVAGLARTLLTVRIPTALLYGKITPEQADKLRVILEGALPKVS